MSILIDILSFPVTGPAKGLMWIASKIAEQAESELYNPEKVRGQLMELEMRYDLGEISEQEYDEGETALLALLKTIRERPAEQEE